MLTTYGNELALLASIIVMFAIIWWVENDGWKIFFSGYMFHVGESMFRQDWMGYEKYLSLLQTGWADLHWGVGALVALSSIFVAAIRMQIVRKRVNLMINGVRK